MLLNGRRRSIHASSPSSLTQVPRDSSRGKFASSPFPEHAQPTIDSESTVSTTAPSTVWDELDDIRSRIRKLELTGKLPPSSSAAMTGSAPDRPVTASTTMTNTSTSPKHHQEKLEISFARSTDLSDVRDVHPLLHTALSKAENQLSSAVASSLRATVLHALILSKSSDSLQDQRPLPGPLDRHLNKQIENLCRNLTELCLAVSEDAFLPEKKGQSTQPASQNMDLPNKEASPAARQLLRATSEDPELRSSSRVMSRAEARRASLQASIPISSLAESSQETLTPPHSNFDPASLSFKRAEFEDVGSGSDRSLSRANTNKEQLRRPGPARASREHLSHHIPPSHPQQSSSGLNPRKPFFSLGAKASSLVHTPPTSRRTIEGSTPPSSTESSRLAEARQRRLASLGQFTPSALNRTSASPSRIRNVGTEA